MRKLSLYCLLAWLFAATAWGRGGGGCLAEGTLIETPSGLRAIESLRPGDAVWSPTPTGLQKSTVAACYRVEPDEIVRIELSGRVLLATPEHPIEIAAGVFRSAGELRPGDDVLVSQGGRLEFTPVVAVNRTKTTMAAYNLLVAPAGTFLANGVAVHNKGCFLPDTPVLLADGTSRAISTLHAGDVVLAFQTDGTTLAAEVHNIITYDVDEYWEVSTTDRQVRVTEEHPFYVGAGTFKTLSALHVGDVIYVYDGHGLAPQPIVRMQRVVAKVKVYNLQVDNPNTYFADGIAVHNKGGGGCLAEGTLINTPAGLRAIETLRPGDAVWSPTPDGLQRSTVAACYRVEPDEMVRLGLADRILLATPEHPIEIAPGVFRCAGDLQPGDQVWSWKNGQLEYSKVITVSRAPTTLAAFNLLVSPAGTFLANGVAVHNKGCFLPDTPILLANGSTRAISTLQPGDKVLAFKIDGTTISSTVRNIISYDVEEYWEVSTADRQVRVTAEHPFYVGADTFKTIAALHVGDTIYVYDGHGLNPQRIRRMHHVNAPVKVYNLQIDFPNTYFADGFAVHNKGGGGYYGGGSGGGGDADPMVVLFVVGGIFVYVAGSVIYQSWQKKSENLDFLFSRAQIARKADKTAKLLDFLSKTDPAMTAAKLEETARTTFLKLQDCWQKRAYAPMQPLLTDHLYAEHTSEIAGMVRNHEVNLMASLGVEHIDIVNVRYTEDPDHREFTALITAHARDYYEDDRTGRFLRGDDGPEQFQEFWIFQLFNGAWRLREIEQSRESDALKTENFFEQFTDTGVKNIYGDQAAAQAGPAGPWQGKAAGDKATRIERMLNFLAKTDKLWDRQRMLDRARAVFVQVISVREGGDPAKVPDNLLFPDVAAHLRADIAANQQAGRKVEFRNLCVRKVELILVRNFADNTRDEYVVRISAHAQRCTSQNGSQTVLDDYVTPFTEYWTFGRLDRDWKLKEVLPPAEGEKDVTAENLDEDSSPQQVQWYYSQTRAN